MLRNSAVNREWPISWSPIWPWPNSKSLLKLTSQSDTLRAYSGKVKANKIPTPDHVVLLLWVSWSHHGYPSQPCLVANTMPTLHGYLWQAFMALLCKQGAVYLVRCNLEMSEGKWLKSSDQCPPVQKRHCHNNIIRSYYIFLLKG